MNEERQQKPLFLKPAQVARLLNISVRKTYELIASKEIPSRRFGSSLRVPTDVIEQMARETSQNGAAGK
jgi:excisionase family DNA binding protein